MSRKLGMICSLIAVFGVTAYVVYSARIAFPEMVSFNELVTNSVDTSQRYLLNYSLFHVPLLFFLKIPYLNPMYKTRIMPQDFMYIIIRALKASVALAAFVLLSNVLSALLMRLELSVSPLFLNVYARMVSFSFFYNLLYLYLYWVSSQEILGVAGVFVFNLVVLVAFNQIKFQFIGKISENFDLKFMIAYSLFGIALCMGLLVYLTKRKEVKK